MLLTVTALASSLVALEAKAPIFAPPYVIAGIAAVVFTFLGFVTFSYKNVAHRRQLTAVQAKNSGHDKPIDEFGHEER